MSPAPALHLDNGRAVLSGPWTLAALLPQLGEIQGQLVHAVAVGASWDLSAVTRLDSAAATLLWRTWRQAWPSSITLSDAQRKIVERAAATPVEPSGPAPRSLSPVELVGAIVLRVGHNVHGVVALFGQLLLDLVYLARQPKEIPWREFSANLFKAGAQALPVAALVGFLIGITISYLSALQLKTFGADLFIVNILGISIIRELGPVLVAVLVAGRSGSAITAQIGVMRVTEEIDALATMGVSRTVRIILPKVAALTVAMPLLVLWTSAVALVGGMLAAYLQLDLSFGYFIDTLPKAVPVANLLIGLGKGAAFGFMIALIACHFGLHVRPNTESLSAHTTTAVVAAITAVIVIDAIFAIMTRNIGMPEL